jgi:hypothetical protein
MAAWTGAGFLADYTENETSVVYLMWANRTFKVIMYVSGNTSGSGQVFP